MSLSKPSINSQQNFTAPNYNNTCIYEFEDFRLDAAHRMLYKSGTVVSLKPKVVETLIALIERPGEVVSKDELMARVWQDSFVEEANLSQNIYLLRKTLGECPEGQPLIETFWRRGYRFNGRVRQPIDFELLHTAHTKTLVVTEEVTTEIDEIERSSAVSEHEGKSNHDLISARKVKSLRATLFISGIAMIGGSLLIAVAALFWRSYSKTERPQNTFSAVKMTRPTPELNIECAVISPDGRYLAYDSIENGRHSLSLKDIASGSSTQIMPPSDTAFGSLNFSPDGTQLYYNKFLKTSPNGTLFRVPVNGGESRAVARDVVSPQTFSPDGTQIAFVAGAVNSLVIAQTDGSGERLLRPDDPTINFETWDSNLSWSPDGTRIAICGSRINESGKRRFELIEVSVADGTTRNIPVPDWNYLDDVQWLNDQTGLIVRAREAEASPWQIWYVSYPSGEISRITNDLNNYDNLSLSADSRLLVVRKLAANMNVWTMSLDAPGQAKQITFGIDANDGANGIAFAHDGKIIYTSPRDGHVDLWMMNGDGTQQQQLTRNAGGFNARPRITPDGRTIVFVSSRTGTRQVWSMDADGGNPSQLINTKEDFEADHAVLSPDGAWVYFNAYTTGKGFISKIAIGGGESLIVRESGWPLSISPDGKLMLFGFYDGSSSQPWKNGVMSLENGEMLKVLDEGFRFVEGWTADSKSLIVVRDPDHSNLWLQPINGGELQKITKFDGGQITNFAISPDFKRLAIVRGNPSAEAVLITDLLKPSALSD